MSTPIPDISDTSNITNVVLSSTTPGKRESITAQSVLALAEVLVGANPNLIDVLSSISDATGTKSDAPLPDGTQANTSDNTIITLLKSIVNNTEDIELTLENNGTIEVAVDDLETYIGNITSAKQIDPDAASANLNSLTRGVLQRLKNLEDRKSGTMSNASGQITLGGTAQDARPSNAARKYLMVQNPSTETESLFVDFSRDAALDGTSIELVPGGHIEFVTGFRPTGRCSVNAATTGHKFVCKYS